MRATARRCYCNVAKCNTSAIGIRKCCTVLKTADYQRDDLVLYMALLFMMWNIFNAMFLQYIHIQYIFFIHFYLPSTQYTYVHISLSFDSVTCRSFSEIMSDYVIYLYSMFTIEFARLFVIMARTTCVVCLRDVTHDARRSTGDKQEVVA